MADAHLQVTVLLVVAAAVINKLPHKGQHIAIKAYKKYTLPYRNDNSCREEFFIGQNNAYWAEELQIFSAAFMPSRAEDTIPPE